MSYKRRDKAFEELLSHRCDQLLADFTVVNEGSIFLLQPLSPAAITWTNECLPEDRLSFGSAVAVEHRFIADILQGITNDGLTWEVR